MLGIEQGLDAEAVPSGEDISIPLVPEDESELPSQSVQAVYAEFFIEMQYDLAVRSRAQVVTRLLEFTLDCFISIEFAVATICTCSSSLAIG